MDDNTKLLVIAREYYLSKKKIFSAEMLFDFILNNNFRFRKDMNTKRIGHILSSSDIFRKNKKVNNVTFYELIQ